MSVKRQKKTIPGWLIGYERRAIEWAEYAGGGCWCSSPYRVREAGERIAKALREAYTQGVRDGYKTAKAGERKRLAPRAKMTEEQLAEMIHRYITAEWGDRMFVSNIPPTG